MQAGDRPCQRQDRRSAAAFGIERGSDGSHARTHFPVVRDFQRGLVARLDAACFSRREGNLDLHAARVHDLVEFFSGLDEGPENDRRRGHSARERARNREGAPVAANTRRRDCRLGTRKFRLSNLQIGSGSLEILPRGDIGFEKAALSIVGSRQFVDPRARCAELRRKSSGVGALDAGNRLSLPHVITQRFADTADYARCAGIDAGTCRRACRDGGRKDQLDRRSLTDGFDLYLGRFDLFGAKQDKPFGKLGLLARFLNVLVGTATWPQHKHCSGD